jgi:hypothetical protein
LNVDALNRNLVDTTEENEDFGCDVMEHEVRAKFPSPHFGDNPQMKLSLLCLPYSLLMKKQMMKNYIKWEMKSRM